MKQFIKFSVVGSIGFIIDASILLLLINILDVNIVFSRLISFLVAVFITWILNRNFTFFKKEESKKKKEYSLYLIIQTVGAMLNYFIFIFLIQYNNFFEDYLIISLAISSIITMFFNFYILNKKLYNISF